jgi:DNA-binding beta-propeller fold protein YncE
MVMRYVNVGHDPALIESPHNIKVSADGKYWYVCFSNGSYFQQYDASNDSLIREVNITLGKWNVITLTSDQKTAFISDLSNNGRLVEIDLATMTRIKTYASGAFSNPHGIAFSQTNDTVYATSQYGNMIYRLIRSIPQVDNISLQQGVPPTLTPDKLDPHEIMMSPDYKSYFITCQSSNELLVVNASNDSVIKSIPMGNFPLEMALSKKRNLLFITCQEDTNPIFPFFKGSVKAVDLNTLSVVKTFYEQFYQPHGIAVDDSRDLLYVVSTNANPTGPSPHHASECAGRIGYFHIIDLNTWVDIITKSELSVFPYSMAVRE